MASRYSSTATNDAVVVVGKRASLERETLHFSHDIIDVDSTIADVSTIAPCGIGSTIIVALNLTHNDDGSRREWRGGRSEGGKHKDFFLIFFAAEKKSHSLSPFFCLLIAFGVSKTNIDATTVVLLALKSCVFSIFLLSDAKWEIEVEA